MPVIIWINGGFGAGEQVLHVFLDADAGVLRDRLNARVTHPGQRLGPGNPRVRHDRRG